MRQDLKRRRSEAAFSLVEIVLALGVFSIAIVAIMGLFPSALNTSQRSRSEAIAAQIGRTVLANLRSADFDNAALVVDGANNGTVYVNLNNPVSRGVLYDANGKALGQVADPGAGGIIGTANKGASFVAIVKGQAVAGTVGLANVTVSVEFPPAAVAANRNRAVFATLISK